MCLGNQDNNVEEPEPVVKDEEEQDMTLDGEVAGDEEDDAVGEEEQKGSRAFQPSRPPTWLPLYRP